MQTSCLSLPPLMLLVRLLVLVMVLLVLLRLLLLHQLLLMLLLLWQLPTGLLRLRPCLQRRLLHPALLCVRCGRDCA